VNFPEEVRGEGELEEILSTPHPETVEEMTSVKGDIAILGAGGKIGPSLCATAVKASGGKRRVYAISRFTKGDTERKLRALGAEVIRADLSREEDVRDLPYAENVIFMVGRKFGTAEDPELTWIVNSYIPSLVAKRFKGSRFAIFSTGNVYPLVPLNSGGATEETPPSPVGEYGWSALARERVFSHFLKREGGKGVILRLNYANELRYGVLVDVALKVLKEEPIDLSMGYVNVIWQGDVNNITLRALRLASNPPAILNLTGPEVVSVRWVASEFGRLLGREPRFQGREEEKALLSNAGRAFQLFGYPKVTLRTMVEWIAKWIASGKPTYGLPTHFEVRTGEF